MTYDIIKANRATNFIQFPSATIKFFIDNFFKLIRQFFFTFESNLNFQLFKKKNHKQKRHRNACKLINITLISLKCRKIFHMIFVFSFKWNYYYGILILVSGYGGGSSEYCVCWCWLTWTWLWGYWRNWLNSTWFRGFWGIWSWIWGWTSRNSVCCGAIWLFISAFSSNFCLNHQRTSAVDKNNTESRICFVKKKKEI